MTEKIKGEAGWVVTPSPGSANYLVASRRDGKLISFEQFRRTVVHVGPDFTVYGKPDTPRSTLILTPVGNTECGPRKAEEIMRRLNTPEQDAEDEDAARRLFDRDGVARRLNEAGKDLDAMRARLDELSGMVGELDRPRTADEVSRAFNAVLDALLDNKQYEAMGVVRRVRKAFEQ